MQQRGEKGLWVLAIGASAVVGFAIAGFPGLRGQAVDAVPTTTVESPASDSAISSTTTTIITTTTISSSSTTPTTSVPLVLVKPPTDLTVRVGNGTRTSGAAAKISDRLSEQGYQTRTPTDTKQKAETGTIVYFIGPYELEAQALATGLGLGLDSVLPATDPPAIEPDGSQLLVIVGTDQAG
ncbi:MAG: LytR C-terminal domain-containing protein [Microthrixaceae bacterium]